MKNIMMISFFVLVITACNNTKNSEKKEATEETTMQMLDTTKLAKGTVYYKCSMHPEVTSDKPGTCPKCGMELEKVEKQ